MSKFTPGQFDIKKDSGDPKQIRIVKMDIGKTTPDVQNFEFQSIQKDGDHSYTAIKKKFGPLASTDEDKRTNRQKDARFQLNSLLRDPLAVEEEERRAIQEKVDLKVLSIADEVRTAAAQEGYSAGLKAGKEEAFKNFKQESSELLARFEAFLNECEIAKEEIFRANERFLIELAFRIAKVVLLRELTTDPDYVLRLSREIIERVGVRENIKIRVNPESLSTAGMLKEGLEKNLGALKNLSIEGSSQVNLGGCMVETQWNSIDASIETQLKGILESLVGGGKES